MSLIATFLERGISSHVAMTATGPVKQQSV